MSDYHPLEDRLRDGGLVLLDGGTGTELERLGAPMHREVWCAAALETHPELVREVHRSYIDAGTDVITANTYAAPRHALEPAGLGGKVEEWNALAMTLALESRERHAAGRPVWVAGSVSTFGNWLGLDAAALVPSLREQARILAASGADLLLVEALGADRAIAAAAVHAAADTGLPVWVAMSCMQPRGSHEMMLGIEESQAHGERVRALESFGEAIAAVMGGGGCALLMMHSDLKVTLPALEAMRAHYDGPLGVYPNAGYWQGPHWTFVDQVTPEVYLAEAKNWYEAGARIIGGCCGIGPQHIRPLRAGLSGPAA